MLVSPSNCLGISILTVDCPIQKLLGLLIDPLVIFAGPRSKLRLIFPFPNKNHIPKSQQTLGGTWITQKFKNFLRLLFLKIRLFRWFPLRKVQFSLLISNKFSNFESWLYQMMPKSKWSFEESCFVCHAVGIYLGMTQDSPLKVWKIHAMKPNCRGQESFFHFTSPPSSLIFISLMAKFHIDGAEKRVSHGCLGQNPTNCSWIFHERWIYLIEVLTIRQAFETKYIFS